MTCLDYVLGEQYAEIRAFLESPQGRRESVRAFGDCLAEAIDAHRAALQDWQRLIESPDSEVWKQAEGARLGVAARRATRSGLTSAARPAPLAAAPRAQAAPHAKGPRDDPTLRGDSTDAAASHVLAVVGLAEWQPRLAIAIAILLAASLLLSVARGRW